MGEYLLNNRWVAVKISTATIAHAGNGHGYRSGRHFSANLGLVPREHSSGGQQKLGGITKRGNQYLRRLLIQGDTYETGVEYRQVCCRPIIFDVRVDQGGEALVSAKSEGD